MGWFLATHRLELHTLHLKLSAAARPDDGDAQLAYLRSLSDAEGKALVEEQLAQRLAAGGEVPAAPDGEAGSAVPG